MFSFLSWFATNDRLLSPFNQLYIILETESESKDKATFPDFVLNPDSLDVGSSVVDAIIKDNTASKVKKSYFFNHTLSSI